MRDSLNIDLADVEAFSSGQPMPGLLPSAEQGAIMECLLDHIVLNVKDMNTMMDFYTEILELPAERLEAYHAGKVPFPSVRIDENTIIDLFPDKLWRGDPTETDGATNLNHFCLAVKKKEWDALTERLASNDIEIEEGPVTRWGARGKGISIYFRDPEKNLIEARHYE